MVRPKRTAAERAKKLIAEGFGATEIWNWNGEGLPEEEEDKLDAELLETEEFFPENEDSTDKSGSCPETIPKKKRTSSTSGACCTYGDIDAQPRIHEFTPTRPAGLHLSDNATTRGGMLTTAVDFFKLYFTMEMMEVLCDHTNIFAWMHVLEKPSYGNRHDGAWTNVDIEEMFKFIALVMLMGITRQPDLAKYWSVAPLFDGGWARRFMARNRFKALLGFIHISKPGTEDESNKLSKLEPLLSHVKSVASALYQPAREISIDERMVKSKARSGIRQFMPLKPVRFGFKLWCLCEAKSGYTVDFNVYTGKRQAPSANGLGYDVVMALMQNYLQQGYRLFIDNFYTSMNLIKTLDSKCVGVCGTTLSTRRGFPSVLKDKSWQRTAKRGDMRFFRQDDILCMEWKDSKPVYLCSSFHVGNEFVMVKRNLKDPNGAFRPIMVKKPMAIHAYNQGMGGVDRSDQLIQPYNVLLKSHRWWKTLFYHMIDVAVVNCFILFQEQRRAHPDDPRLQRPPRYSQLDFRIELIKQLGGISEDELAPRSMPINRPIPYASCITEHTPVYSKARHNCKICYLIKGKENKTKWYCPHPSCKLHFCLNGQRNCMKWWHSVSFNEYRAVVYLGCRHK